MTSLGQLAAINLKRTARSLSTNVTPSRECIMTFIGNRDVNAHLHTARLGDQLRGQRMDRGEHEDCLTITLEPLYLYSYGLYM